MAKWLKMYFVVSFRIPQWFAAAIEFFKTCSSSVMKCGVSDFRFGVRAAPSSELPEEMLEKVGGHKGKLAEILSRAEVVFSFFVKLYVSEWTTPLVPNEVDEKMILTVTESDNFGHQACLVPRPLKSTGMLLF